MWLIRGHNPVQWAYLELAKFLGIYSLCMAGFGFAGGLLIPLGRTKHNVRLALVGWIVGLVTMYGLFHFFGMSIAVLTLIGVVVAGLWHSRHYDARS